MLWINRKRVFSIHIRFISNKTCKDNVTPEMFYRSFPLPPISMAVAVLILGQVIAQLSVSTHFPAGSCLFQNGNLSLAIFFQLADIDSENETAATGETALG